MEENVLKHYGVKGMQWRHKKGPEEDPAQSQGAAFMSAVFDRVKEKLEEQKKTMEKLKKESKRRANDILIKAERQADERKDQIINLAMNNRERMMMKAEADIEKMRQKAKFELQKEVGEMAVDLAEKIIKENKNYQ